jgi:hypothetical protein
MTLIEIINELKDCNILISIEDFETLILDFRLEDTEIDITFKELNKWINKNI